MCKLIISLTEVLERKQKMTPVIIIVLNVSKCKPFKTLKIFKELHKTWYGICVTEY